MVDLGDTSVDNMPVSLDYFYDIVDIFYDGHTWAMCIFNIKNTRIESFKTKLHVVDYYSIRTINTIPNFRSWACISASIKEKL